LKRTTSETDMERWQQGSSH